METKAILDLANGVSSQVKSIRFELTENIATIEQRPDLSRIGKDQQQGETRRAASARAEGLVKQLAERLNEFRAAAPRVTLDAFLLSVELGAESAAEYAARTHWQLAVSRMGLVDLTPAATYVAATNQVWRASIVMREARFRMADGSATDREALRTVIGIVQSMEPGDFKEAQQALSQLERLEAMIERDFRELNNFGPSPLTE